MKGGIVGFDYRDLTLENGKHHTKSNVYTRSVWFQSITSIKIGESEVQKQHTNKLISLPQVYSLLSSRYAIKKRHSKRERETETKNLAFRFYTTRKHSH
ncbi:hypothetical protein BJV82DRAFT_633382 [Fennellomyces sp. T-0311]|nr:hypothetical protein BJV82DRAFT_633382 [Fennellomyces sp. T-0311]